MKQVHILFDTQATIECKYTLSGYRVVRGLLTVEIRKDDDVKEFIKKLKEYSVYTEENQLYTCVSILPEVALKYDLLSTYDLQQHGCNLYIDVTLNGDEPSKPYWAFTPNHGPVEVDAPGGRYVKHWGETYSKLL